MLTLSSSPQQMNTAAALDEIPFLSADLSNGETFHIFAQLNISTSEIASRAYRTDSTGTLISGSEFEISATGPLDTSAIPQNVLEFSDGSIGIVSERELDFDNEILEITRFDLNAGAGYGSLLSTQTIEYTPPAGSTAFTASLYLEGMEEKTDGSYELFVSSFYGETEDATGNVNFDGETKSFTVSATGTLVDNYASAELLLDEAWTAWAKLPNGEYLAVENGFFNGEENLQFKIIDPSVSTTSSSYNSNFFSRGELPGGVDAFADIHDATALDNGNYIITWMLDGFDDDNDGDGLFYAIIDPTQTGSDAIVVDATALSLSDEPVNNSFFEDVEILEDGTFLISWLDGNGSLFNGGSTVMHFTEDGVPIGLATEIGEATSDTSFINSNQLANGDVLVTWGETTASDTNGADVNSATFTVDNSFTQLQLDQFVGGSVDSYFMEGLLNTTFDNSAAMSATSFELTSDTNPQLRTIVEGTGFQYDASGTVAVFAGTVTSLTFMENGVQALKADGINISITILDSAINQVQNGQFTLLDGIFALYDGTFDASTASGSVTYMAPEAPDDTEMTGSAFADALAGGEFNDTIIGLNGNDILTGNGGADEIIGNGGRDTITGGEGDDMLFGNGDIDFINPGAGADIVNGGGSFDRVWYGDSGEGVSVNLTTGEASGGNAEGDVLSNIERVTGSVHDDTIVGNGVTNAIKTGNGNDTVFGEGGRDVIELQGGDDEAHGGSSNDNILGGEGDDELFGDGGFDKLFGGSGNDQLTGGSETDYFVFSTQPGEGFGLDTVLDFEDGSDRLDVRDVFSLSNPANAPTSSSDFTISASAIGVKIKYEAGQVIYLSDATNGITVGDIDDSDFVF